MHHISNRRATAIAILLATILTAGLMAVWALVFMIGSIAYMMFARNVVVDQLVFTIEGQPLLQSYDAAGAYYDSYYVYRTLDGQKIEDPDSVHLSKAARSEIPPPNLAGLLRDDWRWRIVGFRQSRPAPVNWYLVHDEPSEPEAYFVGYQPQSKSLIGYLGSGGFRRDVPTANERFGIPIELFLNGAFVPLAGFWGTEPRAPIRWSALYLVADQSLFQIDLSRQSVESLAMPDKVIAVGTYDELTDAPDKQRLVVRMPEQLQVLSMEGKPLRTIPLTEPMRDAYVSLVGTITDEVIIVARGKDHYSPRELYWISPDGDVTRHEQVTLYHRPPENRQAAAWFVTGVVPIPAVLLIGSFAAAATHPRGAESPDFATAYADIAAAGWLPFLLLLLVSLVVAVLGYRRHRRITPSEALAWTIFVFLLGPPGFVGYWTHRRWPPKARCEHCGAVVPRDRGTCLACAAEFPPPVLEGIEIIA